MLFLRFWRSALAWTAAMVALALANSTFGNFTGPFYHGPEIFLAIFGQTLGFAATYLPVAAFAAGISAARELAAPRARLHLLLALASVAVAVFVLDAYLGPWLRHAGLHAFGRAAGADIPWGRPMDRPFHREAYMDVAAREKGGAPPFDHLGLGIRYHLQVTTSLLAAVMAALGVWVGRWTEGTRNRLHSAMQRWLAGLSLVAAVYASLRFGWHLTVRSGVDPALTASAILVVPVVVLLAAAWTQWVAADRGAAGGFAALEPR